MINAGWYYDKRRCPITLDTGCYDGGIFFCGLLEGHKGPHKAVDIFDAWHSDDKKHHKTTCKITWENRF